MAQLAPMMQLRARFEDKCGHPLAGGSVFAFEVGTSTPKDTYADADGTLLNTHPIKLDYRGEADIFLLTGRYRFVVYSCTGVKIYDVDDVGEWLGLVTADRVIDGDKSQHEINEEQKTKNTSLEETIAAEELRATTAETTLQANLNAEATRAGAAEVALDTKINTETARATAAEAVIDAKVNANGVGNRAYKTYADMDADKANIPAKSKVTVTNDTTSSNNGDWQWDGTNFTKSAYDPLQQAKNYADANPLFKPGVLTASDNLNNMRTEGYFKPNVNVPSLALNYPVVALGELHVRQITGNVCVQTYWVYGTFGQWIRTTDGSGNWNAWEQIGTKSVIDTWIQTGKNPINLTTNNNIDLNTLTTTSTYAVFSTNPITSSNFPEPSVQGFVLVNTLTNVTSQLFIVRGQNKIYVRALWGTNGWTPWELLATTTYVNTKIDSAIAALNLAKYDNLTYFNTLDSLLRDPLKSVRIKFIGDSITWGMADVNDPDSLPRTGQLTDPRKTTAFTTKIWVNLFRQWVARVYGNNAITQDRPGSAYTTKDMLTGWQSIYKKVNMIDKNGTVLIDSVKLSIISYTPAVKSGYAINFPSNTYNTTLKPAEMSLEVYGDNLTIQYKKWNSGDSNDNVEVYVDGVLNSSFNYFDASNTTYDVEHTVEFPYGLHTIRIVNKATNANSYTQLSGFRVNKKIWVINEGIIGSTTKSWLDNSLYEGTLDGKDDVVIPMLGTNDRAAEGGIDGFRKRLNDNIDKINTLSPSSKVILMSSAFAQVDAPSSPYKFDMATVDKIIGDTARERNLMFISNYKACAQARIDGEVIWSDGLHLNDRGNQLYYENVKNKLFTY